MKFTRCSIVAALSGLACVAMPAAAAVDSMSTTLFAGYTQTSNAVPATADFAGAAFNLRGTDLTAATLGLAQVLPLGGGPTRTLTPAGTQASAVENYASVAALNAAVPAGDYVFSISGGTLGDGSLTLVQPAPAFPAVPAFTNFASLPVADPSAPLTLTFTPFTLPSGALGGGISIFIANAATNAEVFSAFPSTALDSVLVPAGTLQFGVEYRTTIIFATFAFPLTLDGSGALENVVDVRADWVSSTSGTFRLVPAPGAAAALGLGALAAARRRRR